jgi:hypothetical protein
MKIDAAIQGERKIWDCDANMDNIVRKVSMSTSVARQLSPEEEELAKKREELVLLQAELADRELRLR